MREPGMSDLTRRDLFMGIAAALAMAKTSGRLPTMRELCVEGRLYTDPGGMRIYRYYSSEGKPLGHVVIEIMDREVGKVRYLDCGAVMNSAMIDAAHGQGSMDIPLTKASDPFYIPLWYLGSQV
jgi:hypothetical protein